MLKFLLCSFLLMIFNFVPALASEKPHFKKVLIIVLENTDYQDALKQPYLQKLTLQGALLKNMNGVTHPSQGNYIAMLAGSTLGVKNDDAVYFNETNLVDLLEKNGASWKGYIEDFPGGCFDGTTKGRYVRKHNPFISFTNISKDPTRCQKIQNSKSFELDATSGNLPHFSIFSPNMDNDGHDKGVQFASKWLEKNFANKFQDPIFMKDLLVVVTFDESRDRKGNQIYTVLLGDSVRPQSVNKQKLNHINILKTIEVELNLGDLGREDSSAQVIDGIWK